jgi:hypothetical protein
MRQGLLEDQLLSITVCRVVGKAEGVVKPHRLIIQLDILETFLNGIVNGIISVLGVPYCSNAESFIIFYGAVTFGWL